MADSTGLRVALQQARQSLPVQPPRKKIRNRTELTLEKKVELIRMNSSTQMSARKLASVFDVGKTQVTSILKRKDQILEWYAQGEEDGPSCSQKRRRVRTCGYNDEINSSTWEWYRRMSGAGIIVTGAQIRRKALEFAKLLGANDFKASQGWLYSFRTRNDIIAPRDRAEIELGDGEEEDKEPEEEKRAPFATHAEALSMVFDLKMFYMKKKVPRLVQLFTFAENLMHDYNIDCDQAEQSPEQLIKTNSPRKRPARTVTRRPTKPGSVSAKKKGRSEVDSASSSEDVDNGGSEALLGTVGVKREPEEDYEVYGAMQVQSDHQLHLKCEQHDGESDGSS